MNGFASPPSLTILVSARGLVLGLLMFWHAMSASADVPERDLVIGVQTIWSAEQTRALWQPTADYLSRRLPGYHFRIEALNTARLNEAVAQGRLAFVLTNPSHYVSLEAVYRVRRIATLVNEVGGHPLHEFGGVIFVRADQKSVRSLADLREHRIAAVGPSWLGGYHAQAAELLKAGIDLQSEVSLYFQGEPQSEVVRDVLLGRATAGFVRTGILEDMDREGSIRLSDFRVLNAQTRPGFPLWLSTPLYPEWPFSASPSTPGDLASRVAVALLGMVATDPAARQGGYYGWAIPSDYQAVHGLMRTLNLPPYDAPKPLSLQNLIREYESSLFAVLVAAVLLALLVAVRFQRLHRTIQTQVEDICGRTAELELEVAARLEAEGQLRLAASVFEHSNDGIVIADAQGHILDVNSAFTKVTGYRREEVLGKNPRFLQSGRHDHAFYQAMWKTLVEHGHWQGEVWNRRKSGEFYVERLDITVIRDALGELIRYVGVFSDITDLRKSQDKLERLAHFDALTHLPNRVLLADRLEQAVARADRDEHLLAVCFMDLDGFKPINDNYGHHIGDLLLIEVAGRLKSSLRVIDTVARLGGDEFALLLSGVNDVGEVELAVSRVIEAIEAPCRIDDLELKVSASIGVSIYPLDQVAPELLLRHADQAMYMAKRAGRGRYQLFDAMEHKMATARVQELARLRTALREGEFVLYYQPRVDMRAGRVVGVEALIRWMHPTEGLVPPSEFLPLLEDDDLIVEIGDWVLSESLDRLQAWRADGLDISISVNVAARHVQAPHFVEMLKRNLDRHPTVPPGCLELEILESAALENMEEVQEVIHSCREFGVVFALDDFGTGYASLSYLKRLPVDVVKIDQSFIRDLLDNPEDLAIVEGIVSLARIFQRQVVGEGVESPEHGVMLMRLGCDYAQGYGIARPMPAKDVLPWCRDFRPDPQWAAWADIPWDYADFPLLVAQSEHNRWIKRVSRFVEGGSRSLERHTVRDHHHCRFGRWYYGDGRQRYGQLQAFVEIEGIHQYIHHIGDEIMGLMEAGQAEEARNCLPKLLEQRDKVIRQLHALQTLITGPNRPDARGAAAFIQGVETK